MEVTAYAITLAILVSTGGKHYAFIPNYVLQQAFKMEYVTFYLTTYTNLLVKVSICLMLQRMRSDKKWRIGLWCLLASIGGFAIGYTIVLVLYCQPVHEYVSTAFVLSFGACVLLSCCASSRS